MADVSVEGDCLEKCEGLIVNVVKTSDKAQDGGIFQEFFDCSRHAAAGYWRLVSTKLISPH